MAKKRWEAVFLKPLSLRGWGFSLILTGTQQRFLLMAVVKVETQSFFYRGRSKATPGSQGPAHRFTSRNHMLIHCWFSKYTNKIKRELLLSRVTNTFWRESNAIWYRKFKVIVCENQKKKSYLCYFKLKLLTSSQQVSSLSCRPIVHISFNLCYNTKKVSLETLNVLLLLAHIVEKTKIMFYQHSFSWTGRIFC